MRNDSNHGVVVRAVSKSFTQYGFVPFLFYSLELVAPPYLSLGNDTVFTVFVDDLMVESMLCLWSRPRRLPSTRARTDWRRRN